MAGKSSQSNNRGADLFGYFVSGKHKEYHTNQFAYSPSGPYGPSGMTATGGVVSDYTHPDGTVYRAHVFTTTGTFAVNSLSASLPNNVDYLVVAAGGGGGGGPSAAGGRGAGGAGGLRSSHPDVPSPNRGSAFAVTATNYTITVGAGGARGTNASETNATRGGNSSIAGPDITTITTSGGGAGGESNPEGPGGSGGGTPGGTGNTPPQPGQLGNPGGNSGGSGSNGGGGGGAGGAGSDGDGNGGGAGGAGFQVKIAGPPTASGVGALNPGPGESQWFAGGGGGGGTWNAPGYKPGGAGGTGGGGAGTNSQYGDANSSGSNATPGMAGTGGGGGATGGRPGAVGGWGGGGGSGVVIVRYEIGSVTAAVKATGGAVSYYNNKTIHTFTTSGAFATAPNWSAADVEYLVVAGGGGSNNEDLGGGGGAGGFITGTTPIGAHPVSTTIQVGAGGDFL